jgi:hypothetical protein
MAMAKLRSNLPLRIAGLAAGLVLAASLFASWRIAPSDGRLGADARLLTIASGELRASPRGVFLSARELRPGGHARVGTVRLRNVTPLPVNVYARAEASDRVLANAAHMELRSGGRVLARGRMAELHEGARPLRLAPQQVRPLEARVWIPRSVQRGYEARYADVTLGLRIRYLRGGR